MCSHGITSKLGYCTENGLICCIKLIYSPFSASVGALCISLGWFVAAPWRQVLQYC